jgi:pimeloyl-ACP methyl ester carboxylesterase
MGAEPVEISLRHTVLRGLQWGAGNAIKILALHGWLDNAAAFTTLGPMLAARGIHLLALDLPGHGLSDHKPPGELYHMADNLIVIDQVQDALQWEETVLLGHSLGGVLGLLYASAAQERLHRLIVLDALGPMSSDASRTAENFARALARARESSAPKRIYKTLQDAAQDRTKGFGGLSLPSSLLLVERNMQAVEGGWQWRTDARLRWPSLTRMSEDQVLACLLAIKLPLLMIYGQQGFFPDARSRESRIGCLPHAEQVTIQGLHHFHMDGDVPELARLIDCFVR